MRPATARLAQAVRAWVVVTLGTALGTGVVLTVAIGRWVWTGKWRVGSGSAAAGPAGAGPVGAGPVGAADAGSLGTGPVDAGAVHAGAVGAGPGGAGGRGLGGGLPKAVGSRVVAAWGQVVAVWREGGRVAELVRATLRAGVPGALAFGEAVADFFEWLGAKVAKTRRVASVGGVRAVVGMAWRAGVSRAGVVWGAGASWVGRVGLPWLRLAVGLGWAVMVSLSEAAVKCCREWARSAQGQLLARFRGNRGLESERGHEFPEIVGINGGARQRAGRWARGRVLGTLAVVVSGVAGAGLLAAAATVEPARPPQPVAEAAGEAERAGAGGPALGASDPVRLEIPAINVKADLIPLGVDQKNEIEVPPLDKAMLAGWYAKGPTPGELGNAVIVGHVDSYKIGPAVFFNLGSLKPGDSVRVFRKDGSVASFKVDGVKTYPKTAFPADLVYGTGDQARLRLVTCGGEFDKKARNYLDNVVVFATYAP